MIHSFLSFLDLSMPGVFFPYIPFVSARSVFCPAHLSDFPCLCLRIRRHRDSQQTCKLVKSQSLNTTLNGCQIAQSVARRTSKLSQSTWWWGRIPSNQPFPKGVALCRPHCSDTKSPSIRDRYNYVGGKKKKSFDQSINEELMQRFKKNLEVR